MRPSGMSSAASALRYWERRQEVTANNLANVSTGGFKAERVFARLMSDGTTEADAATDFRGGTIRPTGTPLDLAQDGPGFFVVESPAGERFTRGGSFTMDDTGRVVDASGHALLGEGGPIIVPNKGGVLTVDRGGTVSVDGREIGRIRVESVPPNVRLVHESGTLFVPPADASRQPLGVESRTIHQGALEDSNVDSMGGMVDMISVQRAYAAVQKAVTTLDAVRGLISNELGKTA